MKQKLRSYIAIFLCMVMAVTFIIPGNIDTIAETLSQSENATPSIPTSGKATSSVPDAIQDMEIFANDIKASTSNALMIEKEKALNITEYADNIIFSLESNGQYQPIQDNITVLPDAGFELRIEYNLAGSGITVYAGDDLYIDISSWYDDQYMEFDRTSVPVLDASGNTIGTYRIVDQIIHITFDDTFIGEDGDDSIYGSLSLMGRLNLYSVFDEAELPAEYKVVIGGNEYTITVILPAAETGNEISYDKDVSNVYYYYHDELTTDPELYPYSVIKKMDYVIELYADAMNKNDISGIVLTDTFTNTIANMISPLAEGVHDLSSFYAEKENGTAVDVEVQKQDDNTVLIYVKNPMAPGETVFIYYSVNIPDGMYYPTENGNPGTSYGQSSYYIQNTLDVKTDNPNDLTTSWIISEFYMDANYNQKKWIEKGLSYDKDTRMINYRVNFNMNQTNNLDGWYFIDQTYGPQVIVSDVKMDFYDDSRKENLVKTVTIPYEELPSNQYGTKTEFFYELFGPYYCEVTYTAYLTEPGNDDIYNISALVPPEYVENWMEYGIKTFVSMNAAGLSVDKHVAGYDSEKGEIYWTCIIDGIDSGLKYIPEGTIITDTLMNYEDRLQEIILKDSHGNELKEGVDYRLTENAANVWNMDILNDKIPLPITMDITSRIMGVEYGSIIGNQVEVKYDNGSMVSLYWDTAWTAYGDYLFTTKKSKGYNSSHALFIWEISTRNSSLVDSMGITEVKFVDKDPEGLIFDSYYLYDSNWIPIQPEDIGMSIEYDSENRQLIVVYPFGIEDFNLQTAYRVEGGAVAKYNNVLEIYIKNKLYSDWHYFGKNEALEDRSDRYIRKDCDYNAGTAPFAEYRLTVNEAEQKFDSGKIMITDTLSGDISLVTDSFVIWDKNYQEVPAEEYELSIRDDGFSIIFPDSKHYIVYYLVYVNGIPNGVSTAALDNSVQFIEEGKVIASDQYNQESVIYESSATAGSTPYITVNKTDESGAALGGAVFGLYQCTLNNGIWEPESAPFLTEETDASGKIQFRNLARDTVYCLQEINPPEGYSGEYKGFFTVVNRNSDMEPIDDVQFVQTGRVFSIVNEAASKEPISVTILKIWEDDNDTSGKRPDEIQVDILNGNNIYETITITEEDEWEKAVLLPYGGQYSVREKEVPDGYIQSVSGYTITNTLKKSEEPNNDIIVKKIWDDFDNQYKTRPESVTAALYLNGEKAADVTLSEDEGWKKKVDGIPGSLYALEAQKLSSTAGVRIPFVSSDGQANFVEDAEFQYDIFALNMGSLDLIPYPEVSEYRIKKMVVEYNSDSPAYMLYLDSGQNFIFAKDGTMLSQKMEKGINIIDIPSDASLKYIALPHDIKDVNYKVYYADTEAFEPFICYGEEYQLKLHYIVTGKKPNGEVNYYIDPDGNYQSWLYLVDSTEVYNGAGYPIGFAEVFGYAKTDTLNITSHAAVAEKMYAMWMDIFVNENGIIETSFIQDNNGEALLTEITPGTITVQVPDGADAVIIPRDMSDDSFIITGNGIKNIMIPYKVVETNIPDGYISSVKDYTITNTLDTFDLNVKKNWDDGENTGKPAVEVSLVSNNNEVDRVQLSEENNWSASLSGNRIGDLIYVSDGSKIKRSVFSWNAKETDGTYTYMVDRMEQADEINTITVTFAENLPHPVWAADYNADTFWETTLYEGTHTIEYPSGARYLYFRVTEDETASLNLHSEDLHEVPSQFAGHYVSILGDSESESYPFADVENDTDGIATDARWWAIAARELGFNILKANNVSGSGVLVPSAAGKSDSGLERCTDLHTNEHVPDDIFILLGGNDLIQGKTLDEIESGYRQMLQKIRGRYPTANIILFNYANFGPFESEYMADLREMTSRIGNDYNYPVINMQDCGIAEDDVQYFRTDGNGNYDLHHNRAGQALMGAEAVRQLNELIVAKYTVQEAPVTGYLASYKKAADGSFIVTNNVNKTAMPETGGLGVGIYYAAGAMLCIESALTFCKKKYHKKKE